MAPTDSQTTETSKRHESDLYTRPGWVDADVALLQVDQVQFKNSNKFIFTFAKKALSEQILKS